MKKFKKLIIACDGESASGKSTAAKLISKKYKLLLINSGLLYRYASKEIINHNFLWEISLQSLLASNTEGTSSSNFQLLVLISKYFDDLNDINTKKYDLFIGYFLNFYDFCFELYPESMIKDAITFKDK